MWTASDLLETCVLGVVCLSAVFCYINRHGLLHHVLWGGHANCFSLWMVPHFCLNSFFPVVGLFLRIMFSKGPHLCQYYKKLLTSCLFIGNVEINLLFNIAACANYLICVSSLHYNPTVTYFIMLGLRGLQTTSPRIPFCWLSTRYN